MQPAGEARAVLAKRVVPQLGGLVLRQRGDFVWKAGELIQVGAADEERDDRDLARKGRLDLFANVIALLFLRALPQDLRPSWTHDDQDDLAAGDGLGDGLREPLPWRDVFDVHENVFSADPAVEEVAEAPRMRCRVFATITDEDIVRGPFPYR